MPWRPLPNIVHAVCVRHFDPSGPDDLRLQLGDQVYITEVNGKDNQWCRGWLLAHPSVVDGLNPSAEQGLKQRAYAGIFPRVCVHIREILSSTHASTGKNTVGLKKGHTRNWSAPLAPLINGVDYADRPLSPGHYAEKRLPSPPIRHDSPQAPLVPKDVAPRRRSYPKEPAPLPALRIGNTGRGDAEPLIEDISSSIREWHDSRLTALALKREYETVVDLSTLVNRLTAARRQLEHGFLTEKELAQVREQVVWDLVRGNKMVDGEVIVRSAAQRGRTLTANDPLPEMAELQAVMSLRDKPITTPPKEPHLSHLLVDVKSVPQQLGDPALLHMSLCSVSGTARPKPVSEPFAVELAIDEATGRVEVADQSTRTLFAEMNREDIGAGDHSDNRLYLICRLVRDEPMHRARPTHSSTPNSPAPGQTLFEDSPDGQTKVRRSLVGRRSRQNSVSGDRPGSSSVRSVIRSTSLTRLNPNVRPGDRNGEDLRSVAKFRRVTAWCAVSVSSLLRDRSSTRTTLSFWAPAAPYEQAANTVSGKDGWNDVLHRIVRSPNGKFAKASSVGELVIDLMAFAHDDVNALIQDKPALLRDISLTPALSLNGLSKQPRSDIYLTLRNPFLPSRAKTFHPQNGSTAISPEFDLMNLQVTLEVRTNDGKRIDDAIHPTANRRPHTAFRSPAIERGESWNQTIKLSLAPQDVPNAHVIMSIADGNNFPFALAWLPLWNPHTGFSPDGPQNLALWDYCEYTASSMADGRGAYQALSARMDDMLEHTSPQMAHVTVETHLSSTSATQNADVLALSNLERTGMPEMAELLGRFPSIPDEEIAKFFGPILVSLNYMLEQSSDLTSSESEHMDLQTNREIADLTVKALVHAARLTSDRRFPHLENILHEYTIRRRPSIEARLSILRCVRALMASPFDERGGRELRTCLKVTDLLLKFALHRDAVAEGEEDLGFIKVQQETTELFNDLMVLLSDENKMALPTQVIIVQNMHLWIAQTIPMCSEQDALGFVSSAADACASNKSPLFLHRLTMIQNVFAAEKLQSQSLRAAVIDYTEHWLEGVWPQANEVDETTLQALRICCTIVKEQQADMTLAQSQRYVRQLFSSYHQVEQTTNGGHSTIAKKITTPKRKTFSPLFPTTYPFQVVPTDAEEVPSELLLELASVIGAFFQPGGALNATMPLLPTTAAAAEIHISEVPFDDTDLARSLAVLRGIQHSGAIPVNWLSVSMSFSRCTVSILSFLLIHLVRSLPDAAADPNGDAILDFDGAIWQQWFDALIALVTSDILRMENHSEQKRRAVWTVGGDVREMAAVLLRRAWDGLGWQNDYESTQLYGVERVGGYQVQFTSTLLPSVVMLGLSLHAGLRVVAVEILRSMIVGEWDLSGDLDVIKSAFADALDVAFRDDKFEPSQAKILLNSLKSETAYLKDTGAESLHAAVIEMLAEIESLIGMLSDIHNADSEDPTATLEQRVNLLEYLKNTNNEDSYLHHIHDVAESQVEDRNFSSAALAMQLHVDLLKSKAGPQTDLQLAKAYPELQLPAQTIYARRQMLYAAMVKYFGLGCCWSKVLDTLEQQRQELIDAFDSSNLAVVLKDQADIYIKMSTGKGLYMPRFFKVTFSNAGFPPSVLGKSFIYEAAPDDETSRFSRRMQRLYPKALVVHSGVTSNNRNPETPIIHIFSVNVSRNQLDPINQRVGVSPFFRLFHLCSNPSTFSNSTRQQKPGLAISEQTVAKTLYFTKDKFPTILGRSEIIKEEAHVLAPIQAAIDRTHRKTMDIAEMLMSANTTDTSETDKLVQLIRSSVDPTSIDSVAGYHELLLDDQPSTGRISPPTRHGSAKPSSPTARLTNGTSSPPHPTGDPNLPSSDEEIPRPVPGNPAPVPADARCAALTLTLTTALQDHVLLIEQALSAVFDYRQAIKLKLRNHFESTFEPELFGLYPDGSWRTHSPAWKDTLPLPLSSPQPAAVRSSIYSDLNYSMSGGAGWQQQQPQPSGTDKRDFGAMEGIEEGGAALPSPSAAVHGNMSGRGNGKGYGQLGMNGANGTHRLASLATNEPVSRNTSLAAHSTPLRAQTSSRNVSAASHRRWESTPSAMMTSSPYGGGESNLGGPRSVKAVGEMATERGGGSSRAQSGRESEVASPIPGSIRAQSRQEGRMASSSPVAWSSRAQSRQENEPPSSSPIAWGSRGHSRQESRRRLSFRG